MNRFRKLKNDDKGMTLVEVIIAITILGIVVVPVLQSLTTSMAYNAKARVRQELTLTAESIMESFKGYGIDELKTRFDGVSGASSDVISGVTAGGYSYSESTVSLSDGNTASQYVFTITDMEAENGQLYNVEVTAKPNGKENVIVPEDSESTRSAVFLGDRTWDTGALASAQDDFERSEIKEALLSYFDDEDAITQVGDTVLELDSAENIEKLYDDTYPTTYLGNYLYLYKRTLTIDINDDGASNYVVNAGLTYSYRLEGYPYYVMKVEPESVKDTYYDEDETETAEENEAEASIGESRTLDYYPAKSDGNDNYIEFSVDISSLDILNDNEDRDYAVIYKNPTSAGLDRLYVYFYPQYDLSAGNDVIEINNNAGISNLQCYVIKQRTEYINDTNTKIKDGKYKGNVQINDSTSSLVLYHNFGDNIADGSSTTTPSITGAAGSYGITADVDEDSGYAENIKEEEVLSYKVKLVITNSAGSTVTSLESTMNESITE